MDLFSVRFLALDRVPKLLPIEFVENEEQQELLLMMTLRGLDEDTPLPRNQVRDTLEAIVRTCEAAKIVVIEEVYERLVKINTLPVSEKSFGRFRIGNHDIVFGLYGDQHALVQNGSTGFTTWEAGKCLSWYLSCVHDAKDKRILEIGCGTGVTGIVTALFGNPVEYVFTDYHESTLGNAKVNWDLNQSKQALGSQAKFELLDMHAPEKYRIDTDIIVGSDILYDESLAVALVRALEYHNRSFKEVLIASTIRTPTTYALFMKTLSESSELQFELIKKAHFSEWIAGIESREWSCFLNSSQLLFDPEVELVRIVPASM